MPLFQSIVNTQGGPARNEKTEILDTNGDPIPHLYGCGELGDIWSCFYQAGCNFGGGIAWGRVAGVEAAAVKDDVTQESLMGVEANSTQVDTVVGATLTSNGIIEAVNNPPAMGGSAVIDERKPQVG